MHRKRSTLLGSYHHVLLFTGQGKTIQVYEAYRIGGLFFADVQGPFDVEPLERSVYKVGIIEVKT